MGDLPTIVLTVDFEQVFTYMRTSDATFNYITAL